MDIGRWRRYSGGTGLLKADGQAQTRAEGSTQRVHARTHADPIHKVTSVIGSVDLPMLPVSRPFSEWVGTSKLATLNRSYNHTQLDREALVEIRKRALDMCSSNDFS